MSEANNTTEAIIQRKSDNKFYTGSRTASGRIKWEENAGFAFQYWTADKAAADLATVCIVHDLRSQDYRIIAI